MSYVIVARDYKNRVRVIGPYESRAHAQSTLDWTRAMLGNGTVDARVCGVDPESSLIRPRSGVSPQPEEKP